MNKIGGVKFHRSTGVLPLMVPDLPGFENLAGLEPSSSYLYNKEIS